MLRNTTDSSAPPASSSSSSLSSLSSPRDAEAPAVPDWNVLRAQVLRGLPPRPSLADEGALQGCVFEMRRNLLDALVARYAPDSVRQEDMLREALPPLEMRPGPFRPEFSAWRSALAAVLGLVAASALVQGLSVATGVALAGGAAVLGGLLGAGAGLWLLHALALAAAGGSLRLPWGSVRWKVLLRWLRWGGAAVLAAAVLRDFFAGRDALGEVLAALGLFLGQGNALGLLGNVYTLLGLLGVFALCVRRPVLLDREAFEERLMLAARNWWGGAACAAEALAGDAARRREASERQWRQVGRDLYSLAGELPSARRQWLEDRLHRLGLEAPRSEGMLVWGPELGERYEPLGHLEPGDACYVDMPPLLENGRLLRKGSVRKVRG